MAETAVPRPEEEFDLEAEKAHLSERCDELGTIHLSDSHSVDDLRDAWNRLSTLHGLWPRIKAELERMGKTDLGTNMESAFRMALTYLQGRLIPSATTLSDHPLIADIIEIWIELRPIIEARLKTPLVTARVSEPEAILTGSSAGLYVPGRPQMSWGSRIRALEPHNDSLGRLGAMMNDPVENAIEDLRVRAFLTDEKKAKLCAQAACLFENNCTYPGLDLGPARKQNWHIASNTDWGIALSPGFKTLTPVEIVTITRIFPNNRLFLCRLNGRVFGSSHFRSNQSYPVIWLSPEKPLSNTFSEKFRIDKDSDGTIMISPRINERKFKCFWSVDDIAVAFRSFNAREAAFVFKNGDPDLGIALRLPNRHYLNIPIHWKPDDSFPQQVEFNHGLENNIDCAVFLIYQLMCVFDDSLDWEIFHSPNSLSFCDITARRADVEINDFLSRLSIEAPNKRVQINIKRMYEHFVVSVVICYPGREKGLAWVVGFPCTQEDLGKLSAVLEGMNTIPFQDLARVA